MRPVRTAGRDDRYQCAAREHVQPGTMNDNTMTAPCPQCGRKLRFGQEALGRKAKCPSCTRSWPSWATAGSMRSPNLAPGYPLQPDAALDRASRGQVRYAAGLWICRGSAESPWRVRYADPGGHTEAGGGSAGEFGCPDPGEGPSTLPTAFGESAIEARIEVNRKTRVKSTAVARRGNGSSVCGRGRGRFGGRCQFGRGLRTAQSAADIDLLKRGLAHCREARYGEGLHCFEQVIAAAPADARAHYYRGRALYCLGRYAEAVTGLRPQLGLEPRCTAAKSHRLRHCGAFRIRRIRVCEAGNRPTVTSAATSASAAVTLNRCRPACPCRPCVS